MTAEWGRTLAKSGRSLTMLLLDPKTGTALGVGERAYLPRQKLRDQVANMSPTCSWVGCGQPTWKSDLDHVQPFDHRRPDRGGRTTLANLRPRCRWHHLLKTHGNWIAATGADGSTTMTSPTGHCSVERPFPFTLPGEWLEPTGGTDERIVIGATNSEHSTACAAPLDRGPVPPSEFAMAVARYLSTQRRHDRFEQARIGADTDRSATGHVGQDPTQVGVDVDLTVIEQSKPARFDMPNHVSDEPPF